MKQAELIKDLGFNGRSNQRLYRCNPPLDGHEYVIVSGADAFGQGEETYIFPATKKGVVSNWGELHGSYKGSINHEQALKNAGYKIKKS
jgi:hypothetical protein